MDNTYSSSGKETISVDITEESGKEPGKGLKNYVRMFGTQKIWAHPERVRR